MGAQNSLTTGLFGLGGAIAKGVLGSKPAMDAIIAGLSDERAKRNIKTIGRTPGGHRVVAFDYKKGFEPFGLGGRGNGGAKNSHALPPGFVPFGLGGTGKRAVVIAQKVEKKQPGAVMRRPDGMRVVNYAALR